MGLATPKDFGSHYKVIVHHKMLRNYHNNNSPTVSCRICNGAIPGAKLIGACPVVGQNGVMRSSTCSESTPTERSSPKGYF